MKALVLIFLGASLLVSCVALPKPETESDSLVIGFFSLVFPGGYFSSPLTTIDRGVELDFRDVTTGRWHVEFTIGGTFKFIAHGGDRYALISSRASLLDASRRFIIGPRAIKLEIPSSPGKVVYLGDIQLTYTTPTDMFAFHPTVDYEIQGGGGRGFPNSSGGGASYLNRPYDVTMSQTWDKSRLRDYMKRIDPASPWLSRDIVDVKLKNPSGSVQPLR